MSDPNDKLLDDYLRRDSVVSKQYRALDTDEVPSSLDDAVLAQARMAAMPRKKSQPNWVKWGGPIALAASAVMAVAIVIEIGVDEEVRLPAVLTEVVSESQPTMEERVVQEVIQEAPVAAAPPAVPPPPLKLDVAKPTPEDRAQRARVEATQDSEAKSTQRAAIESLSNTAMQRERQQDASTPAEASSRGEAPEPKAADSSVEAFANAEQARDAQKSEVVVTGADVPNSQRPRPASAPTASRRTASSTMTAPVPAAAPQAPRLAPDLWLEQIRALRREGKVLEADEQWKEFSAAYPQHEVAQSDSARPAPVR